MKYLAERVAPADDPRRLVKALSGGEYWRYRVGPYRVLATIEDDALRILVVRVAHRNHGYRQ
nr:type II toxin-antitoxin system RelE/ParE family toxin [Thioalkalivibrio sp. ALJ7]